MSDPPVTTSRTASQPSTIGRYRVVERLAAGGMGEVFLAVNDIGDYVAVKRLLDVENSVEDHRQMFFQEATLHQLFNNEYIASLLEIGESEKRIFFALEYVDGVSVRRIIDRLVAAGQLMHPAHVAAIARDACYGLAYAHLFCDANEKPLHIVHRDVNPNNLMVGFDGKTRVIDFGIAKSQMQRVRTKAGVVKGKFAYMSPEQASAHSLDARSDIFSLGVCLFELLAGFNPLKHDDALTTLEAVRQPNFPPLDEARPDSRALNDVVARMLAPDRENRPPSTTELAASFALLVDLLTGDAKLESLADVLTRLFAGEPEILRSDVVRGRKRRVGEDTDKTATPASRSLFRTFFRGLVVGSALTFVSISSVALLARDHDPATATATNKENAVVEIPREVEPPAVVEKPEEPEPPAVVEVPKEPEPPAVVEKPEEPEPPAVVEKPEEPEPPAVVEIPKKDTTERATRDDARTSKNTATASLPMKPRREKRPTPDEKPTPAVAPDGRIRMSVLGSFAPEIIEQDYVTGDVTTFEFARRDLKVRVAVVVKSTKAQVSFFSQTKSVKVIGEGKPPQRIDGTAKFSLALNRRQKMTFVDAKGETLMNVLFDFR